MEHKRNEKRKNPNRKGDRSDDNHSKHRKLDSSLSVGSSVAQTRTAPNAKPASNNHLHVQSFDVWIDVHSKITVPLFRLPMKPQKASLRGRQRFYREPVIFQSRPNERVYELFFVVFGGEPLHVEYLAKCHQLMESLLGASLFDEIMVDVQAATARYARISLKCYLKIDNRSRGVRFQLRVPLHEHHVLLRKIKSLPDYRVCDEGVTKGTIRLEEVLSVAHLFQKGPRIYGELKFCLEVLETFKGVKIRLMNEREYFPEEIIEMLSMNRIDLMEYAFLSTPTRP